MRSFMITKKVDEIKENKIQLLKYLKYIKSKKNMYFSINTKLPFSSATFYCYLENDLLASRNDDKYIIIWKISTGEIIK